MNKNYYQIFSMLMLWAMVLFGEHARAQVSGYAFNQLSGTYTPITGGTVFGTTTSDDQRFVDPATPAGGTTLTGVGIPIGFNFTYNGIVFDRLAINNNGWISLGQSSLTPSVDIASSSSYTALSSTATNTPSLLRNRIAGIARDLQAQTGAEIRVETIGTAPNRICVVQWTNYKRFGTTGTGDALNFQIRLFETSNYVQVMYGSCTFGTSSSTNTHVGLGGTTATDFNNRTSTTSWLATTAGTTNAQGITLGSTVTAPSSGTYFIWGAAPAVPPAPTQAVGTPTCSGGSDLTVTGSPANTDEIWYWQTTPTGTSTTDPASSPWTVFANGTYYVRAFNTLLNAWSTESSITVTNFPVAPTPPAPVALANPACVPGTTISVPAAPVGTEYYWQGTTLNGSSNTESAATPYNVTTTGTYYVAAFETATQCWSPTSGVTVTVDSQIPNDPTVSNPYLNICTGATSGLISATTTSNSPGSLSTTSAGGNGCGGGAMFNITTNANPVNLTSLDIIPNVNGAQTVEVFYKTGTYLGSETTAGNWTSMGTYPITGTSGTPVNVDIADLLIPASSLYAIYVNYGAQYTTVSGATNYTNADMTITAGAGLCSLFGGVNANRAFNGTVNYTIPMPSSATWFDAPTGGNVVGTGTPFETVGSSVLPTATNGSYDFYVASTLGGCYSANRELVTVNVNPVVVYLSPIDISCNDLTDGSFALDSIDCGTAPFMYSVNGGPFGAIPTNLTAGTYSIVAQDATMALSAPNTIVVTEPGAPQNLNALNVTYFNGQLTWTPQGSETTWNVEYGPAGFTPGTGIMVPASNDTIAISGLTENTAYEFYVQAGCIATSDWAGPFAFSTDPGFLAWDNECPTMGFFDISGTGTDLNLTDDSETGITLPFAFPYQGGSITDLTVGNNGGIQLGTLSGAVGYGGNMTTITGDYLFPWGDDMDDETGNVYYQVTGTTPNQVAIFQWNNQNNFSNGAGTVTFQIQMYEATGEIYYVYDDVVFGGSETADDYAGNADIGLSGPTTDINVSNNSQTYLQNNSCVHFYYALCPNVQNMIVIPATDDAQLNWDPGLYGETSWTLVYGLEGFDPSIPGQAIDTLELTTSDTNFGFTLDQMTTYDVYIYSECQADNLTSDGFFVQFTTLPNCSDITTLAGTTDIDSLELTWNWNQSSPVFPVTGFNVQYGMNGFALGNGTIVSASGIDFSDTIFDASLIASGVYQVYVQAACAGTNDTSNWVGPISVVMPATNDIVCDQEALLLGTDYTFNTTGATVSLNETNIAPPATGSQQTDGWVNSTLNGTLWYSFVAPATGQVRIDGSAINFNSQAAVYSATNCADFNTFTLLAANDDAIGGTSLAPNFTICDLTPGNTYYLMVDKFNATNGNFAIRISDIILNAGTANPLTNVCVGDTVNLFNTISGYNTGGVWSSSIPAVNVSIVDSLLLSDAIAFNTYNIQYRVTDGCAYDSIISQVKIYAPSNAGQDGSITACKNEPIDLLAGLNGNADLNGNWFDPSDSPIPSSQIITANFPGQYNYDYISGNGVCPNDTANVVVTVGTCDYLSVEESALEEVSLYPNPSTGVVFIESTFTGNFDLVITDINGRTIQTGTTIPSGTNTVNLKEVERGTYFFKLSTENAEKVFRVVIQ
ncbi:T9SS type A sorting domain-containing protein [Fluviicola chungangensis]|uniref:T9SS type A sorting domain-containing protein n=1 Tax=Fluviicola chungangensis TaxID=2597671 RepID=A0A556N040_9FLAO|nr:T9SS type A sorting domain-containing protein [Fluviicola chungangensis]TSJ45551.1 T9SS type A sorting domain-containing protein [Fluviicola chungangensis]